MTWLVAIASLLGTWLNVRRHVGCFWIWSATNAVWSTTCFRHGLSAQGWLHLVYLGLAIWGIRRWSRHAPSARSGFP
jgi:nicotinamide mononucleotide transporter